MQSCHSCTDNIKIKCEGQQKFINYDCNHNNKKWRETVPYNFQYVSIILKTFWYFLMFFSCKKNLKKICFCGRAVGIYQKFITCLYVVINGPECVHNFFCPYLSHLKPMFAVYTPYKHKKSCAFNIFSWGKIGELTWNGLTWNFHVQLLENLYNTKTVNKDLRTCAYQGVKNVSFSENFTYVPNEWSHIAITHFTLFYRTIKTF